MRCVTRANNLSDLFNQQCNNIRFLYSPFVDAANCGYTVAYRRRTRALVVSNFNGKHSQTPCVCTRTRSADLPTTAARLSSSRSSSSRISTHLSYIHYKFSSTSACVTLPLYHCYILCVVLTGKLIGNTARTPRVKREHVAIRTQQQQKWQLDWPRRDRVCARRRPAAGD